MMRRWLSLGEWKSWGIGLVVKYRCSVLYDSKSEILFKVLVRGNESLVHIVQWDVLRI